MRSISKWSAALAAAAYLTMGPAPAAPASARDLQRAAGECQEGTKLLMANDVVKAKERFTKALTLVPTYPDALLGMGHVDMREGRFDYALKAYQGARDGYKDLGESILDLQAKRYTETQRMIATLRDNLRNMQSSQSQNSTRAEPTQVDRRIAETEDQIRRLEAVQMPSRDNPTEPPGEVYFHMGNAQFRLNAIDDAIDSWEMCAQKSPKFSLVHNNLAVAYWKKGRVDDAKKALAHAKELGFPVNPQFVADLEKASSAGGPPANPSPTASAPAKP
jgi:tetratricopeptide (TPR) repeat protein